MASTAVLDHPLELTGKTLQGQVFYTPKVSRIANANTQACMISSGTDWKLTGRASEASAFEAARVLGSDIDAAFEAAGEVDMMELSSNTPFISFLSDETSPYLIRFGTGFALTPDTVRLQFGPEFSQEITTGLAIEPRGDTAVVVDPEDVATLHDAYLSGQTIRIVARSQKANSDSEHYLSYEFEGGYDTDALLTCQTALSDEGSELRVSGTPDFTFVPAEELTDPSVRKSVRAMACNRDLDPNGAELVRLDGPILGFATPLAYALVQRDDEGEVQHIWSGDLWRLSRNGDGFDLAFSNSVTSQGPLDAQLEKACTRFARASCASFGPVVDDTGAATGAMRISSCFGDILAASNLEGDEELLDPYLSAYRPGSSGITRSGPSSTGGGGGGGGTTGGGGSSSSGGGDICSSDDTGLFADLRCVTDGGDGGDTPNPIPVPGGFALMLPFIIGGTIIGARRRKTA